VTNPVTRPPRKKRPAGWVDVDIASISTGRRVLGIGALLLPAAVLAWLILGLLDVAPPMIEIFGETGLRAPAGAAVAGLLIAAAAFWNV